MQRVNSVHIGEASELGEAPAELIHVVDLVATRGEARELGLALAAIIRS